MKRSAQKLLALSVSGCLALLGLLLTLGTAAATTGDLDLVLIAAGFNSPVYVTNSGVAGDGRLFVLERAGRIRIVQADGTVLGTSFLDFSGQVYNNRSLGMAFDPDYANNGYFYVHYAYRDAQGDTFIRVARFQRSAADANLADPASELVLLSYAQALLGHFGSGMQFGVDGFLYIATGDGGSGNVVTTNGQANNVLLGKILRIDVGNGSSGAPDCSIVTNYTVPANPFADGPGGQCDEIWATGLRNPLRISFDRQTDALWIADIGQDEREEIDYQPAGGGGKNYGWKCYEGSLVYDLSGCGPPASYTMPVFEYGHDEGCSVTGGFVYRGSQYSTFNGHYFFSDYCSARFWSLSGSPISPTVTNWTVSATLPIVSPLGFGEDIDGELYVVDIDGGGLYQLTSPVPTAIGIGNLIAGRPAGSFLAPLIWLLALATFVAWRLSPGRRGLNTAAAGVTGQPLRSRIAARNLEEFERMTKSKARRKQAHHPQAHHQQTHHPQAQKKERGTWLAVWLIVIAVHSVLTIFLVRYLQATSSAEDSPLFLPLTVLVALITLVSVAGMWTWHRWGLVLYAAAIVGSIVLGVVTTGSMLTVFNQILPAAILAYLLTGKWDYFG